MASRYVVEHLNHLGIVAEVCREIGVAAWLDQQEPGNRQRVSVGTATLALVLNGLGFSNRQLYLVPQFFADNPLSICWVPASPPTRSTTAAWGAHSIDPTNMT